MRQVSLGIVGRSCWRTRSRRIKAEGFGCGAGYRPDTIQLGSHPAGVTPTQLGSPPNWGQVLPFASALGSGLALCLLFSEVAERAAAHGNCRARCGPQRVRSLAILGKWDVGQAKGKT